MVGKPVGMPWTPTKEEIEAWTGDDDPAEEPCEARADASSNETPGKSDPLRRLRQDAETVILSSLTLAAELPFALLTRLVGSLGGTDTFDGSGCRRVPFFEEDL